MFQRAQRKKSKLRLSIAGISGSGKTWSALELATGMFPDGKIALIDSEAGRAELYGDDFIYDCMRISAPFTPKKYIDGIKNAEKCGYDVLIIDSLSHAWAGDGGVLSIAEAAGGQFQNGWKKATPEHNALVEAIVQSNMHIIVTMRSKSDYVVELNAMGKNAPRKVGLAPVQRDGLEYEMTIAMDMNLDHIAHITKDNTQLFDQQFIKPSKEMGKRILDWLNGGIDLEKEFKENALIVILKSINESTSLSQLKRIYIASHEEYSHYRSFDLVVEAKENKKIELEKYKDVSNELGLSEDIQM